MCNLTSIIREKQIVVYKAVHKIIDEDGVNYYSFYAFIHIKKGRVIPQTKENIIYAEKLLAVHLDLYDPSLTSLFNPLAVGKCSGFGDVAYARELIENNGICFGSRPTTILKVTLGGEIAEGDSKGMGAIMSSTATIYAGSEIIDYEEVK